MNLFTHSPARTVLTCAIAWTTLTFTLGCAGLSQWSFEAVTGGAMEITDDGVVIEQPDGTRIVVLSGDDVVFPADFPVPEPWEDAKPTTSTTTTTVQGETLTAFTFDLERTTDELIAQYKTWFSEAGIVKVAHTDQTSMGIRTASLVGTDGTGHQVTIAINEVYGQDSVVVAYGSPIEGSSVE